MINLGNHDIVANNFGNNDNILICALFTLNPNTTFFKKLDLSNKSSFSGPTTTKLITNKELFNDFYAALNTKAVRQLAYTLLTPIFRKSYRSSKATPLNFEQKTELELLEKYLKKFHYIYFRYFFPINDKIPLPSTNKELNTQAINALFLILGL